MGVWPAVVVVAVVWPAVVVVAVVVVGGLVVVAVVVVGIGDEAGQRHHGGPRGIDGVERAQETFFEVKPVANQQVGGSEIGGDADRRLP